MNEVVGEYLGDDFGKARVGGGSRSCVGYGGHTWVPAECARGIVKHTRPAVPACLAGGSRSLTHRTSDSRSVDADGSQHGAVGAVSLARQVVPADVKTPLG